MKMKKKRGNKKNNLLFILILATLSLTGILLIVSINNRQIILETKNQIINIETSPTPLISRKLFGLEYFKFSILVPSGYKIEDQTTSVLLRKGNSMIEIYVSFTNYNNLNSYLVDLSKKNHFELLNQEAIKINDLNGIKADINDEKNYFIYHDYAIYSFSTKAQELSSDLDQIARSFRYEP